MREENNAVFATFTTNGKFATFKVYLVAIEFLEFADAQASGIKSVEDGEVALGVFLERVDGGEKVE